ncbi:MAG: hypothetical protein F6K41_44515 [Symploca sp. SIO3E6]|nr:hypothetical protein [Caldora sp. SIO3E6]
MPLFRQYTALNALGLVIAILATSCGETKVAQCNKLVEVINKGEPLATNFQQETAQSGTIFTKITNSQEAKEQAIQVATTFNQFAQDWKNLNQEVQTVELADETIIALQQRYLTLPTARSRGILASATFLASTCLATNRSRGNISTSVTSRVTPGSCTT